MQPTALRILDDMHGALHQSRILIVDDAVINLLFLRNILMHGGFTDIRTAENGEEALELCDTYKPDIIILDLIMEGMDGFECCRRIRARTEGGDVPILIQTALTDQDEKVRTFREGATDFISKPIFPDELYARVIVHLEKQLAMKKLQTYKQRVEQELHTARDLQAAILPKLSDVDAIRVETGLDIASYFKPSSELGGDFWGIRQLGAQRVAFWIVDFSGHGVAAALNVFRLHTVLQEDSAAANEPGDYLTEINERLIPLLPRGQFATMFYGIIDLKQDELRYAGAGSPHPIVLNMDGANPRTLDGTGQPLGIIPHRYPTRRTEFDPGDCICFYSDALTETVDVDGVYIDEAQIATLLAQGTWNAETSLLHLLEYYDTRTLLRNRRDDLTIGLICRQGRKT
jgi:sigma-B regulation protein RsbU (phosphoserine phosphatase)